MKFYRLKMGKKDLAVHDLAGNVIVKEETMPGKKTFDFRILDRGYITGRKVVKPIEVEITDKKEIKRLFGRVIDIAEKIGEKCVFVSDGVVLVDEYLITFDDRELNIGRRTGDVIEKGVVERILGQRVDCEVISVSIMPGGVELHGKTYDVYASRDDKVEWVCAKIKEILLECGDAVHIEYSFGVFEISAGEMVKVKRGEIDDWLSTLRDLKAKIPGAYFHRFDEKGLTLFVSGKAQGRVVAHDVDDAAKVVAFIEEKIRDVETYVVDHEKLVEISGDHYSINGKLKHVVLNFLECDEECVVRELNDLKRLSEKFPAVKSLLGELLALADGDD